MWLGLCVVVRVVIGGRVSIKIRRVSSSSSRVRRSPAGKCLTLRIIGLLDSGTPSTRPLLQGVRDRHETRILRKNLAHESISVFAFN